MKRITALLLLTGALCALSAENRLVLYWQEAQILDWDRSPLLQGEISEDNLTGERESSAVIENGEVKLRSTYRHIPKQNLITAEYDSLGRAVHVYRGQNAAFDWTFVYGADGKIAEWKSESQGIVRIEKIERTGGRIHFIRVYEGGKNMVSAENFYWQSNELKTISLFPGGRLGKMRIWKFEKEKILFKEKIWRMRNADFITVFDGGSSTDLEKAMSDTYQSAYEELAAFTYSNYSGWDKSVLWNSPQQSISSRLIETSKGASTYEAYEDGLLIARVRLDKAVEPGAQIDETWKIFNDTVRGWSDYQVEKFDRDGGRITETWIYKDALLQEKTLSQDGILLQQERFTYYPSRKPMERVKSIKGSLAGRDFQPDIPKLKLPEIQPSKKAPPLPKPGAKKKNPRGK